MKLNEVTTVDPEQDVLLEGGAAIKGAKKISQEDCRAAFPDLHKKITTILGLKKHQVKFIGSAGKKEDGLLSGDIDVAVEADRDHVNSKLKALAWHPDEHRAMKGINIYSFGHRLPNEDIVQVDLVPTKNVDYTEWSMQSNPEDLERGLKGAHRNELMFATAKHAGLKEEDDELRRYFYDLSRGLYKGVQKKNKKGTGYETVEKEFVTNDVNSVVKTLYGPRATKQSTASFAGCMKHIKDDDFPHAASRGKILAMAAKGMEKKGLKVPKDLMHPNPVADNLPVL